MVTWLQIRISYLVNRISEINRIQEQGVGIQNKPAYRIIAHSIWDKLKYTDPLFPLPSEGEG